MSGLSQQITDDMKTAMRGKNTVALGAIRMLKAAVKNAAIKKGGADAELDDAEIVAVVRSEVKKRQDSLEQYTAAGRAELAQQEEAEIAVLQAYLPEPLAEEELAAIVETAVNELGATSRKEMGAVMKLVNERAAGRADGKTLSQAVMARLS